MSMEKAQLDAHAAVTSASWLPLNTNTETETELVLKRVGG